MSGLWRKQFKLRLYDGTFISLNKLRPRFSFQSLRRYTVRFAPVNLYMSVLNWLMPESAQYRYGRSRVRL